MQNTWYRLRVKVTYIAKILGVLIGLALCVFAVYDQIAFPYTSSSYPYVSTRAQEFAGIVFIGVILIIVSLMAPVPTPPGGNQIQDELAEFEQRLAYLKKESPILGYTVETLYHLLEAQQRKSASKDLTFFLVGFALTFAVTVASTVASTWIQLHR